MIHVIAPADRWQFASKKRHSGNRGWVWSSRL